MGEFIAYASGIGSLFAIWVSLYCLRRAEPPRLRRVEYEIGELKADMLNFADLHERLHKSVHKLRTRAGSEDARKKKIKEAFDSAKVLHETPEEWKARMMREYPQGALSKQRAND